MMVRMLLVLNAEYKPSETVNNLQTIQQEWIHDGGEPGSLNKQQFTQSIFELADHWVDSINAQDYEDFMYRLLWEIAKEWPKGGKGAYIYRERDIWGCAGRRGGSRGGWRRGGKKVKGSGCFVWRPE